MLAIQLPKEIEKKLENLAHKTGRTKTYYAREAIINYIDDLEDIYLALNAPLLHLRILFILRMIHYESCP